MSQAEGASARRLWASVLEAAVEDAKKSGDSSYFRTRDFRTVASLAGLDPEAVADRIFTIIKAPA